jgi:hypothetical protein
MSWNSTSNWVSNIFFFKVHYRNIILPELRLNMIITAVIRNNANSGFILRCNMLLRPSLIVSLYYYELQHEKKRNCVNTLKYIKKSSKRSMSGHLSTLGNLFWISLRFMWFNLKSSLKYYRTDLSNASYLFLLGWVSMYHHFVPFLTCTFMFWHQSNNLAFYQSWFTEQIPIGLSQ